MQIFTSASAQHESLFTTPSITSKLVFMLATLMATLTFAGALSAQLVINEVDYDQAGTDAAEFVEIKNVTGAPVNLTGFSLELINGAGGSAVVYDTIALPAISLAAGGYFVVCANAATVANCDLDDSPNTNFIQNGAPDAVGLRNAAAALIDTVSYEGDTAAPYTEGSGVGLVDDPAVDDTGLSRSPDGSDTNQNNVDFDFCQITPGASNDCTVVDDPPTVTGNTPADGSTGVAVNANIDITFSEDVTTTDPWFTINCVNSGAHIASVSGGPQTFNLDPVTDFSLSENCDVEVIATQVSDQDGDADNMASNYQFSFDTNPVNAADLIINEVDADQSGIDDAEFVELYDGGAGNTALDGLVLVLMNGSDDASYLAFDLDGQSTGGDGYFVLCGNAANTANCDMDVSPDTNLIQNGADAVALYIGDATDFPNDTPVTTTGLLDAIVYDTNDGDDAGLLVLLNAAQPQVNEGGAGDKDNHSNQRCPNASGGARNTDTYGQFDPTPGLTNLCGAPAPILINEVDADQTSTDIAEFVELYDGGAGNTALDGLVLVLMNGSDDASYNAFDLDGQSTGSDGYFVLCVDAANTPNCDLDVPGSDNVIQNGADAVALYTGDATDFPNDTPVTTTNLLDALVYDTNDSDDAGLLVLLNGGQPQVNEDDGVDKDIESNQRCPNGTGGPRNSDTYVQFTPTPGTVNCVIPPTPEVCGDPVTLIHDIQGAGLVSPMVGTPVSIEGIVVGDFQDGAAGANGDLDGFFVQEEDADADADALTSEGIFIYDPATLVDVQNGDRVRVAGTVAEFNGLTELTFTTFTEVCVPDAGLPSQTVINLPRTSIGDWEPNEGMWVTFPQTLFVSGNFTLARFGELDLSVDAPLDNPTNVVPPGVAANALQDLNNLSRIQLDDGSSVQNPMPLPPYLDADLTRRVGDSTSGLSGVLGERLGVYEVQPTETVNFVNDNVRPLDPPDVGPALIRAAGFNVLNYFTTLDDSGSICGPSADQGCRGADNAVEFDRQKAKLLAALSALDADVVGLIELENAFDNTPIADLVDGLNTVLGAGTYAYVPTDAIGGDAIRQGIIYKPDSVTMKGAFETLDSADDPLFDDTRNRPALAQTFSENSTGEKFTVVVNHLKSKGSNCNGVGDPDTGDGQGNCNLTRTSAAVALVDWLAGDPTASGDSDTLIMGDLNAYAMEDPIMAIMAGGHVDLINAFAGTGYTDGAYSFSFAGQAGYLDHALSSPSLLPEVSGTAVWHINGDEPVALDYNTEFNPPALYNPDQFRSSDHDAVLVGLFIDADEDGVWDQIDACPNTVIPESVPTESLGTNRFALVDGDGVFDTTAPNGNGPQASFDIFDTAGCSCEQIIEAQELGDGHRMFGCSIGEMEEWVELVMVR